MLDLTVLLSETFLLKMIPKPINTKVEDEEDENLTELCCVIF